MKIQVISDIHLEFSGMYRELDIGAQAERDLLIVAGDLCEGINGDNWLEYQCTFSPVVYVTGNHEYYGHDIEEIDAKYRELEEHLPDFHFLQKDVYEQDGVRIAGCTLWTDFLGLDNWSLNQVRKVMTDWSVITYKGKRFHPQDSQVVNQDHRNWLQSQKDIDIVVTHHAPSEQSITDFWRERGKVLNPAFAGNSDYLVEALAPKYWIHGHMHSFIRYWHNREVNGTQILCNPVGYGGSYQERTGWNDKLIITV